jgi:methylthioribose-1-phosphate isomerase
MGEYGSELISDDDVILTHCNAGSLATAGIGTALGVIKTAWRKGKKIKVIADETRPLLQGARLTAFEMLEEGIPVTVIPDSTAAFAMQRHGITKVIVGADRIAANGDTANKIGTYGVAILAKEHGIPFYVAAPTSTIDSSIPSGKDIPIEYRDGREVAFIGERRYVPDGAEILSPAFDVTPNEYIAGIITEKGILKPPFEKSILKILGLLPSSQST